jgi:predicted transcriptional regulator
MHIEISNDLNASLTQAAKLLKKTQSALVEDALRNYLEDIYDAQEAELAYQEWQASGGEIVPFEKVLKDVGLA